MNQNPNHALTKQDLKVLRTAPSIVFHYQQGKSYINCIVSEDRSKDVQVDCNTRIANFVYRHDLGEVVHAAHVINFATDWDSPWKTVAELLREGDILEILWMACNNSQYLTEADLYKDEVQLMVRREDKRTRNGYRWMVFNIGSSVCRNNTAKMIAHTSTPKSVIGDCLAAQYGL